LGFHIGVYPRESAANSLEEEIATEQMGNLTFGIIKPDAVAAGDTGNIIQRINDSGFKLRAMKLLHMTQREAEGFYAVHRERPFFGGLTEFMSSAPCCVMVLEKDGAVKAWRDLMGATDPAKADEGTLRKDLAAHWERTRSTVPTPMKTQPSRSPISLVNSNWFSSASSKSMVLEMFQR